MNEEKNLNLKVNPTSNTAITTLIMLANARYEKAAPYLSKWAWTRKKSSMAWIRRIW